MQSLRHAPPRSCRHRRRTTPAQILLVLYRSHRLLRGDDRLVAAQSILRQTCLWANKFAPTKARTRMAEFLRPPTPHDAPCYQAYPSGEQVRPYKSRTRTAEFIRARHDTTPPRAQTPSGEQTTVGWITLHRSTEQGHGGCKSGIHPTDCCSTVGWASAHR